MDYENTVFVIDHEDGMSRALAALLGTYDMKVEFYADSDSFIEAACTRSSASSCLFFAIDTPDADSLSQLHRLSEEPNCPPIIALTTDLDDRRRQQIEDAGARDVIERFLASAYLFTGLEDIVPGARDFPHTLPSTMELNDGTAVTFRMMRPEDADMEQAFVVALSERSRYLRFFSGIEKLPKSVLKTFTHPEFPVSYAVIATVPDGNKECQIGVARYAPTGSDGVAEFAVVVADEWQGRGVASRLMRLLITAATVGGIQRLEGLILKENVPMLAMAEKLGFTMSADHDAGPSVSLYTRELREPATEPA